jgi:hypothetical protein
MGNYDTHPVRDALDVAGVPAFAFSPVAYTVADIAPILLATCNTHRRLHGRYLQGDCVRIPRVFVQAQSFDRVSFSWFGPTPRGADAVQPRLLFVARLGLPNNAWLSHHQHV